METETSTASSILLDSETYVRQGVQGGVDTQVWADTFKSLGGTEASVRPGWAYGTDGPVLSFVGTPEALAYVESNL